MWKMATFTEADCLEPLIVLIPGAYIEADAWCRERGIDPRDRKRVVIVSRAYQLRGYDPRLRSIDVQIIGTAKRNRRDWDEINDALRILELLST